LVIQNPSFLTSSIAQTLATDQAGVIGTLDAGYPVAVTDQSGNTLIEFWSAHIAGFPEYLFTTTTSYVAN